MVIDDYYIGGCIGAYYWLLVTILLVNIGAYYWLLVIILLVDIDAY